MNCSLYDALHRSVDEILFSYESATETALRQICKRYPELLENRDKVEHCIQQQHSPAGILRSENHLITFDEKPVASFSISMDYMFGVVGYFDITYFG